MNIPTSFDVDHLSVSELRLLLGCGIKWFFERGSGVEIAEDIGGSPRLRGHALDSAANEHFRKKAEDGVGLSKAQMVELAVEIHEGGVDTHMFELPEWKSRDRIAKQAALYHTTFGSRFSPRSVTDIQCRVEYADPDLELPVHGVIDLVTDHPMIVDNKVKRRPPTDAQVHADFQLTTYAMMTGVHEVALAVITDDDRPQALFFPSYRNVHQIRMMKVRYNLAARSIKAGALNPAQEGTWFCNEKWCQHWNYCPFGGQGAPRIIPGIDD